ncbi:MAG TPA: sigma-70 family RNA polymerase sigma factor, partial [Bacteroidota bacterium]|nr:sigma-70 family RNA polymerase sigma factor [Bacteroidota bacterium]
MSESGGFDELYTMYGERILRLAYRFTRDEEAARDLTQEIFIKVYEHMEEFRQEAQIYTWIHRIAVNH